MTADELQPIRLYGSSISYFTGKMENYFRVRGIDYELLPLSAGEVSRRAEEQVGSWQMPALELGDGRWMTDSTAMIQWFEEAYPEGGLIPVDPALRFFSLLLEDYADEWLWRPAMHYRWHYSLGAHYAGQLLALEVGEGSLLPVPLRRWLVTQRQRRGFTRGDGITADQVPGVEAIYHRTLEQLEAIFQARPFLLGDRPSLIDIGFSGPLFRHFAIDPVPAEIMRQRAPAVVEWLARLWNWSGAGGDGLVKTLPDDFAPLLREIGAAYLPYLNANAAAVARGVQRFDAVVDGVAYRGARTSRYRVWCLSQLRKHFEELTVEVAGEVRGWLEAQACWDPLWECRDLPISADLCARLPFHADAKMLEVYQ